MGDRVKEAAEIPRVHACFFRQDLQRNGRRIMLFNIFQNRLYLIDAVGAAGGTFLIGRIISPLYNSSKESANVGNSN